MFIYKITNNINGKIYIGQTINSIQKRFHRHINDAIHNKIDTHLARAIRYYGPENFSIELIDDTAKSQEELTRKEHDWIIYYNSIEEGYNETSAIGKCGGNTYQSKSKEEMEIIKKKLRESKLGGKNPKATSIKCKNIETNEEYFFDSMAEAVAFFNQTNHQFISRRCRGEVSSLFKGKWKFAYKDNNYGDFSNTPNIRFKKIRVENLDNGEINIFDSCNDGDRFCGFGIGYLSKKFKKTGNQDIIRDNYKITLLK